jgi:hypothetical protein
VPVPAGTGRIFGVVRVHQPQPVQPDRAIEIGQERGNPAGSGQVVAGGEDVAGVQAYAYPRVPAQRLQVLQLGNPAAQRTP